MPKPMTAAVAPERTAISRMARRNAVPSMRRSCGELARNYFVLNSQPVAVHWDSVATRRSTLMWGHPRLRFRCRARRATSTAAAAHGASASTSSSTSAGTS